MYGGVSGCDFSRPTQITQILLLVEVFLTSVTSGTTQQASVVRNISTSKVHIFNTPNLGGAIARMGETTDTTLTSEQEYAVLLKFLRKQNLKVGVNNGRVVCTSSILCRRLKKC